MGRLLSVSTYIKNIAAHNRVVAVMKFLLDSLSGADCGFCLLPSMALGLKTEVQVHPSSKCSVFHCSPWSGLVWPLRLFLT